MDFTHFMSSAINEAQKAYQCGEVPVGAVITLDDKIIVKAYNQVEIRMDPTAHAEILAIREAASIIGNHRLIGTTMFVTIEPCGMCAGALVWARVKRLIYGADDPKAGACGSVINMVENPGLNHRIEVIRGVLKQETQELIQQFFREKRVQ